MKQIYNNQKGFTLIELIVVIFITSLIATISLANYRQAEKRKRVSLAADGIVGILTQAQSYTLSGKSTTSTDANCRTPAYYYVHFSYSNQVTMGAYNATCNANYVAETYTLPERTRIKTTELKVNSTSAVGNMYIYFYPPFGKLTARRDNPPDVANFSSATITVESPDGLISKTVTVDGVAGRIGQ